MAKAVGVRVSPSAPANAQHEWVVEHVVRDKRSQLQGFDDGLAVLNAATMLEQYFPVLLFVAVGLALGAVMLTVGKLVSPSKPDPSKLSPYECGFEAF
ncbi:MAG: hypothetical protein ABI552_09370, partial [Casimicrobiaceae bacterium]